MQDRRKHLQHGDVSARQTETPAARRHQCKTDRTTLGEAGGRRLRTRTLTSWTEEFIMTTTVYEDIDNISIKGLITTIVRLGFDMGNANCTIVVCR